MYYNFIDDVAINKHNTIHSNGNTNVTKMNRLVNCSGNNCFAKKIEHTSNITNNITRHNHNNYEHNAINVHTHTKHICNYDTEINYYTKHLIQIIIITSTIVLLILE